MRVGHGYDVHRFDTKRRLILGGVEIPHTAGLLGHSDADVVLHAICDAVLGAMGDGDLGRHFPDTDPRFKDVSSRELLRSVAEQMRARNYRVGNLDATIVAQAPKLAPYLTQMEVNIAADLMAISDVINVKATTTEGLGFTGREEGIAAHAVVLLEKK